MMHVKEKPKLSKVNGKGAYVIRQVKVILYNN